MDFKRILVPVEFSECSTKAAGFAADLARRAGAEITLLHVWEPPPFSPPETLYMAAGEGRETLWQHVKKQAEQDLAGVLADASERGVRVTARKVTYGDPAATIVEEAKSGGYDLLVLGTHGRTGFSHLALGSVAEKVVRRAQCPVITVPPDKRE